MNTTQEQEKPAMVRMFPIIDRTYTPEGTTFKTSNHTEYEVRNHSFRRITPKALSKKLRNKLRRAAYMARTSLSAQ